MAEYEETKVAVYLGGTDRVKDVLGFATINHYTNKATIEIDFTTPMGKELLEFWADKPETLGLAFLARPAFFAPIPFEAEEPEDI